MADLIISQPMTFTVDVKNGLVERPQRESLMRGDKMANRIIAELVYGSEPFDITGVTVKGKFCRPPNGDEIDLAGEAKGNVAEVQLTDQCYTSGGHYEASVILVLGGVERTVLFISGDVLKSGSGNAAGDEDTDGSGGSTGGESTGSGLPAGGTAGQILAKKSAENYDTHWIDPPSGSGTGGGVADSVAWDNVTDKPSTYPPAAHTHPEYLGKNETAANATQLNGKSADQYALKTDLPNVPVQSVNGKTGAVNLSASDVGALAATGTAADSDKLGGVAANEYAKKIDIPEDGGIDLLTVYPVGSIYMSISETSPAALFGGTWESIGGRFLLGADATYTAGSTGGEATHKLTEDELPALRGTINVHGGENGSNYWNPVGVFAGSETVDKYIKVSGSTLTSASSITGLDFSAGNDVPHNNMPPWEAVNIWKRVA